MMVRAPDGIVCWHQEWSVCLLFSVAVNAVGDPWFVATMHRKVMVVTLCCSSISSQSCVATSSCQPVVAALMVTLPLVLGCCLSVVQSGQGPSRLLQSQVVWVAQHSMAWQATQVSLQVPRHTHVAGLCITYASSLLIAWLCSATCRGYIHTLVCCWHLS